MVVLRKLKLTLAAMVLLCASMLQAADGEKYTLNMQNADIKEVIDLVAKVTGKTFIIDPRVRGNVTVISESEMTESQIYETFLATLEVYGFSAVVSGEVVKIISQSDIKSSGIDVDIDGSQVGEEIVTRVFPIENVTATELVPILRPLVAKYGHLAGVASANVLIVADRAANMERLSEIIDLLDRSGSEEIEVVELQHAFVSSMITLLESISPTTLSSGKESSSRSIGVHLVGDERSNRILVKGEAEDRKQIIALIKKLDTPVKESGQSSSYKVIYLNYADAVSIAEILKGISEGSAVSTKTEGAPGQVVEEVVILADQDLNALVVKAPPSELRELEDLIAQLDIAREQVLIEAAIMEISGSTEDAFGVQWITNPENTIDGMPFFSYSSDVAGNTVSTIASAVDDADSAWGAVTGVSTGTTFGIADPFGSTPSIMAIIQALDARSNTNLLSTPSVMTLDNTEAFITVGSEVPFITGGSGTDDDPYTIDREDVGTTLTVIPHVQHDGTIRLEVDQSVESIAGSTVEGAVDIITTKKEIKTEILVDDGNVIILGGLISDELIEYETKVPLLSSIPILGGLFTSTSYEKSKTNLLVILRPTVIKDDASKYRNRRLNGIWELRIQSYDEEGFELRQPGIESIFEGTYLDGVPEPIDPGVK